MRDPLKIVGNRPGLPGLDARIGAHSEFKALLIAGLADRSRPALARLTTRDPADFTLALCDAWACVADVITFYQERLADECYLGTCRDPVSVRELARTIGYAPSPGLAAAAHLAFTVDEGPAAAPTVTIEPGLQVMSVPGPGEAPAIFETVEAAALRPGLNAIAPVASAAAHRFRSELTIVGVDHDLAPGDRLLLVDGNADVDDDAAGIRVVTIDAPTIDATAGVTRVRWSGFGFHPRTGAIEAFVLRREASASAALPEDPDEPDQTLRFADPLELPNRPGAPRVVVVEAGGRVELYPHFAAEGPTAALGVDTRGRASLAAFGEGAALSVRFAPARLPLAPAPLRVDDAIHVKAPPPAIGEGDALLVRDRAGERWALAIVAAVRRDLSRGTSIITPRWSAGTGPRLVPEDDLQVHLLRLRAPLFGHNAPDPLLVPMSYADPDKIRRDTRTLGFEVRMNDEVLHPEIVEVRGASWVVTHADDAAIDLAYPAPQLQPGADVVLIDDGLVALYRAADTVTTRRQDYTLDAPVTRVVPEPGARRRARAFPLASTLVLHGAEALTLAEVPLADTIAGDAILIPGTTPTLAPGRPVIIEAESTRGEPHVAVHRVVDVTAVGPNAHLRVDPPLPELRRASLRIRANVVRATHGETVEEVLGGGDRARGLQRFELGHAPLTHLSAASAGGRRRALEVRVGGLLWEPRDDLASAGPDERVYTVGVDPAGRTYLQFGDGVHGARLPTGVGNVRARYRKGLGLSGQVRKDSLTVPLTRPPGVRAVLNPLAAAGGADPEGPEAARQSATRSVIALGRAVSLRDFEDFARAFAGVAKAQATALGRGRVALTVAGPGGAAILPASELHDNLAAALRGASDPTIRCSLHGYDPIAFTVAGAVQAAAGVGLDDLRAAIAAALARAFGFDARDFAAPVYLSEVIAAIHAVPGVRAVDLDRLARPGAPPQARPPERLLARAFDPGTLARTELLTLDLQSLADLEVIP
ncbi:MAG: baseplate J/gp47 family protein [Nannocystaceae bacterium]